MSQARADLQRLKQRFQRAFEQTASGLIVLDSEGNVLYANAEAEIAFERSLNEMVGKPLGLPMQAGKPIELTFRSPESGEVFYTEIQNNPIKWEGKPAVLVVLHDLTSLKVAEKALHYQQSMADVVRRLSHRFTTVSLKNLPEEIENALEALGQFMVLDRCYLRLFSADLSSVENGYEWAGPGYARSYQGGTASLSHLAWSLEKLKNKDVITISQISTLSSEAAAERELWEHQGLKSIALAPLLIGKRLAGFLAGGSARAVREWTEEDIYLLKQIGEMMIAALERRTHLENLRASESRLQILFEKTGVGINVAELNGRIVESNVAFQQMLGYHHAELERMTFNDYTHPEDVALGASLTQDLVDGKIDSYQNEKRYIHKDGRTIWVNLSVAILRESAGQPKYTIGVIEDISDRKQAETELQALFQQSIEQHKVAEALRQMSATFSATLDVDTVLESVLDQVAAIAPYDSGAIAIIEGGIAHMVRTRGYSTFGPEAVKQAVNLSMDVMEIPNLKRMVETGKPLVIPDTWNYPEWVMIAALNHVRSWVGVPIRSQGKTIAFMFLDKVEPNYYQPEHGERLELLSGHIMLAMQNARLFGEMEHAAATDSLTGLYNRRYFSDLAERELERSRRHQYPLSVMLMDMDDFKQINDTLGHLAGDEVLREVARRLESSLRPEDILGRFGGDEFIALLPEANIDLAVSIAERLRQAVGERPIETRQGQAEVTFSIGVAELGSQCATLQDLLERADKAHYISKRSGKNQVVPWD